MGDRAGLSTMNNIPLLFIFIMVALQLTVIAMLQHVYANKNVKRMSDLLHAQSERIAQELQDAIREGTVATKEGTKAAHDAYEVANTINEKLATFGLEQTAKEIKPKETD
jgi:predicted Holliday junction resolvase-like endonuclease